MALFLSAHWLDIVTTVLGLAYILLEYKASVWMWAVGFLMQSLGIVLYYQNWEKSPFPRGRGWGKAHPSFSSPASTSLAVANSCSVGTNLLDARNIYQFQCSFGRLVHDSP